MGMAGTGGATRREGAPEKAATNARGGGRPGTAANFGEDSRWSWPSWPGEGVCVSGSAFSGCGGKGVAGRSLSVV